MIDVVYCQDCVHRKTFWYPDNRLKAKGYYIFRCELNSDSFVTHVVDGYDNEFCSKGVRKTDFDTYYKGENT